MFRSERLRTFVDRPPFTPDRRIHFDCRLREIRAGGRMFGRRHTITIRVSRRVLWVDSEAYPLQNIARVTPQVLRPSFTKILQLVGRWVLVAYVALMGFVLYSTQGQVILAGLVVPAILGFLAALLIFGLIRLFMAVTRNTLYRLDIETAGSPYAVLASPNRELVTQISHSIMEAIDNPQAEFQFQVENFHVGDTIRQFGNSNIGKVAR